MARRIEDIFDECVERINRGESIESCLEDYQEIAHELEILLRTFLNIRWRGSMVQPSYEFKAWSKANLRAIRQTLTKEEKPAGYNIFGIPRIWVTAIAALLIFILIGSVGTVAASNTAMPDQPLYPVKLATEQIKLALTFSDTEKAILNARIAEIRSTEIEVMAAEGKTDKVLIAAQMMINNLEQAEIAINKIAQSEYAESASTALLAPSPIEESTPAPAATEDESKRSSQIDQTKKLQTGNVGGMSKIGQAKSAVDNALEKNVTVLEEVYNKVPDSAKFDIQNVIEIAKAKREKIKNLYNQDIDDERHNEQNNSNINSSGRNGGKKT